MKPVFLSAGLGQWYSFGVERLKGSLREHGWRGDIIAWRDDWPDSSFPRDPIYNIKPAAFRDAIKRGYTTIIWGDASVTAERDLGGFVELVDSKGYWLGQSGYNCAQTCSDACLKYFGVSRDEAELISDCATGIFGVNMDFVCCDKFIRQWIQAGLDGAYRGSRMHGGQSADPRFLFHRQDQSCASLLAHRNGMKLDQFIEHCRFRWDKDTGQEFKCEGMA